MFIRIETIVEQVFIKFIRMVDGGGGIGMPPISTIRGKIVVMIK